MTRDLLTLGAVVIVAASVVGTGIAVVEAKHRTRALFVELEELNREQDRLQVDWWRLQLEQSTWATHPRIESLAREKLHLTTPADAELVVVVEP